MSAVRNLRQLIDHNPAEGQWGDCQRTCVAAILGMNAEDVPHFCDAPHYPQGHDEHWQARQDRWLAARGLGTMIVAYSGDTATLEDVLTWTSRQSPQVPMILAGTSKLGCNHVVVVLNGEIVCDPSGNGIGGPTKENTWEVSCLAFAPSADTRPEGGDAKQAPFTSGAVGASRDAHD
jgi:hypothetical protein